MKSERSDDNGPRVDVKTKGGQRLLNELTSTLAVRAERIRLQRKNELWEGLAVDTSHVIAGERLVVM